PAPPTVLAAAGCIQPALVAGRRRRLPAAAAAAAPRQRGRPRRRAGDPGRAAVLADAAAGLAAAAAGPGPARPGAGQLQLPPGPRHRLRAAGGDAGDQTDGTADPARRPQPARLRPVRPVRHLPARPGPAV